MRPTPLVRESSGIDTLESDLFRDSSNREAGASLTPRDSITQRKLNAKRDIKKDFVLKEVSRVEVFNYNTYIERLYNN